MKMPSARAIRNEAREEGESYEHERREYERGEEARKRKKRVVGEGEKGARRLDRAGRKSGGRNWISGAIHHPGALRRQLGVPEGEKIPAAKLEKAAHSDNPTLRRRANLAKTLSGLRKD